MDAKMLRRRLFQSTTWMLFIMICVAEAVKLNEHILHYEGLNYDTAHVNLQHRRVARSTDIQQRVEIKFNAHGRDFHLRLKRDVGTFSKEFRVVTSQGEIPMPFQDAPMYIGDLVDEIDTYCHGSVREGKFEGRIQIPQSREYYSVEPSSRYLEGADFHSVIYKDEDVVQAETKDDGLGSCGVKGEIKERMDEKLKNLRHSEADVHDVPYRKKRQTINEDEQTCSLFIQADHTFYERHGSVSAVVTQIGQHVQAANAIYGNTDFGDYRNISFSVERLRVWTPEDIGRTSYLFGNNYIGVEKFLDLASTGNFNAYCLAYTFANRDFANGVLGLAWIASSSRLSNGGICDKQASNGQTLNTGIVTTNNYESNVPPLVSHLTFAHEIGHSFGSQHDPGVPGDACVPGGALGNYIMFSHSSAGNLVNNQRFSPCSITTISNILSTVFLGYSKTNCFKSQSDITFCGNGITEEGEECDCGYEEECTHSCCVPQNADHTQPNACRLANQAQCSPTEGVCCDSSTCTYKASSEQCEQSDECHGPAFCPGDSSICPVPTPEADLTQCDNGRKLCHNGECTRSICFLQNRRECQCTDEAELCDLCCLDDRTNLCLSSYRLGLPPGQAEPLKTDAGSPCGDYMGYCDGFHNCREVDEDGPLASIIRKIFYSDEPQLTDAIREWLTTYWYVVLIIGIAIIILMILIVVLCNRVIPTDNPWDQEVERFKKRSSVYVKLQRKRYRGSMAPGMHPPPIESHPDHLVEDRATPF